MENGRVIEYDISLSKRDGIIVCMCPDAQCRGKTGNVLRLDKPHKCKHISKLCHTIGAVLAPTGATVRALTIAPGGAPVGGKEGTNG